MNLLPPITSNDYTGAVCTLVHRETGEQVRKGDQLPDFRGDVSMIVSGVAPHKCNSEGFVHTECGSRLYAGVFDLRWVHA
jgi:hypothetical protein